MAHYLSDEELTRTAPAEVASFASPVPTQIVSNGEFNPLPQTREQQRVEARIKELADDLGPRHGMNRRQFLASSAGMAAAFLAMNEVFGPVFDVSVNGTYVHATLDDTGLLIPYVPDLVLRGDGAVFTDLPWKILNLEGRPARITLATGITFVGRRPLPFGTRSDRIFTIDTNLEVGWPILRVGLSVTNLLDSQYRLGEYNFASDFHSQSQPTLVPVRHFAAGAPRALLFTITTNFGGSP